MTIFHLITFSLLVDFTIALGFFDLQILTVRNSRGELSNGNCCDGKRDASGGCPDECETYFKFCLKEYQAQVAADGKCAFGNLTGQVLGGNSFTFTADSNTDRTLMILPFDFAWTVRAFFEYHVFYHTVS
ncbi:unnamed protein product [Owenia fusiformis]|uniref:Uncharacterized protein n=1 Tax=Owenia fusiformis TaxID=6347 RepID=A0A8J1XVX8_OWEFU|nr:unnamed protein product [Owenia fusiformis]